MSVSLGTTGGMAGAAPGKVLAWIRKSGSNIPHRRSVFYPDPPAVYIVPRQAHNGSGVSIDPMRRERL